jgi:hypothetical protein
MRPVEGQVSPPGPYWSTMPTARPSIETSAVPASLNRWPNHLTPVPSNWPSTVAPTWLLKRKTPALFQRPVKVRSVCGMRLIQARDDLPEDQEGVGTILASQLLPRCRFSCPRPKALQEIVIGESEIKRPDLVNLLLQWPGLECHPSIMERFDDAVTDRLGSFPDRIISG